MAALLVYEIHVRSFYGDLREWSDLLIYTVFLQSDAAATIYFTARFVRLLFEGGVYFFGKPGDINNGWIRYVRV